MSLTYEKEKLFILIIGQISPKAISLEHSFNIIKGLKISLSLPTLETDSRPFYYLLDYFFFPF